MAAVTPYQLAIEVEVAFDNRDRETMQRALAKLVVLAESQRRPEMAEIARRDPQPIDPSDT